MIILPSLQVDANLAHTLQHENERVLARLPRAELLRHLRVLQDGGSLPAGLLPVAGSDSYTYFPQMPRALSDAQLRTLTPSAAAAFDSLESAASSSASSRRSRNTDELAAALVPMLGKIAPRAHEQVRTRFGPRCLYFFLFTGCKRSSGNARVSVFTGIFQHERL